MYQDQLLWQFCVLHDVHLVHLTTSYFAQSGNTEDYCSEETKFVSTNLQNIIAKILLSEIICVANYSVSCDSSLCFCQIKVHTIYNGQHHKIIILFDLLLLGLVIPWIYYVCTFSSKTYVSTVQVYSCIFTVCIMCSKQQQSK